MPPPATHRTLPRVTVLGIGNVLARDEGVGPRVVEQLQAEGVPENVELVDLGSGGIALLTYVEDADCLIIVDCALMDAEPGTIRVFEPGQVESRGDGRGNYSLHSGDVMALIELGEKLYDMPLVRIVGVQPEELTSGIGLTATLQGQLAEIVSTVRREISQASVPDTS